MAKDTGSPSAHSEEDHYYDTAFATRAIHSGQAPDPLTGAVAVPVSLASTFAQKVVGVPSGQDHPGSHGIGYEYCRTGNPSRGSYETQVASLEKAKHCVAYASGSAAEAAVVHLLNSGDHVISIDDVYGGTQRYFRRVCQPAMGISFDFVDLTQPGAVGKAVRPNTKLLWMETPTNPTLKIVDIKKIAAEAHEHNLIVVVDNTFMSPYFQQPLELGADICVNSITKYMNGHCDVVGGTVTTRSDEIAEKLRFLQNGIGAVPSPMDCYLVQRGLKTLALRMEAHQRNAMAIATMLEASPLVEKVAYPGLPSHPQHAIAKAQMSGFGGMVTFWIKGGLPEARGFLESVRLFTLAESLGGVESLAESPALMTHASVPPADREKLGISDTLIRLSCGIENQDDLMADVKQALNASSSSGSKL